MTPKECMQAVFNGNIPDMVPHFELVFHITREAFGLSWPSGEEFQKSSQKERERLLDRHFLIWEKIIERYGWAAIQLPVSLHGFFDGQVIPMGRKRFGDRTMIYDFNGHGTFWMPPGNKMMDFVVSMYETPKQLHEEARLKVKQSHMTHGKPNGRYIFSTSNCLFPGMPLESYHIMLEVYNEMARY